MTSSQLERVKPVSFAGLYIGGDTFEHTSQDGKIYCRKEMQLLHMCQSKAGKQNGEKN